MIEVNAPALLVNLAEQALDTLTSDLTPDNLNEVIDILYDISKVSQNLLDWLKANQQAGADLPITWTEFIHR